jgi:hypothetical protein
VCSGATKAPPVPRVSLPFSFQNNHKKYKSAQKKENQQSDQTIEKMSTGPVMMNAGQQLQPSPTSALGALGSPPLQHGAPPAHTPPLAPAGGQLQGPRTPPPPLASLPSTAAVAASSASPASVLPKLEELLFQVPASSMNIASCYRNQHRVCRVPCAVCVVCRVVCRVCGAGELAALRVWSHFPDVPGRRPCS